MLSFLHTALDGQLLQDPPGVRYWSSEHKSQLKFSSYGLPVKFLPPVQDTTLVPLQIASSGHVKQFKPEKYVLGLQQNKKQSTLFSMYPS